MKRPVYHGPERPGSPARGPLARAKHRARNVLLFAAGGLVLALVASPGKAAGAALALVVCALVFVGPMALVVGRRRLSGLLVRRPTRPWDDDREPADDEDSHSSSWPQR